MHTKSLWHKELQKPAFPTLNNDIQTDVLVVGAGMAGILLAYKLKQAGVQAIVVERSEVGGGVTQNTTAKITAQHGLIYDKLIRSQGIEKAGQYFKINEQAIREFQELATQYPCDLEEKTAYLYSVSAREKLEQELMAYERLHIPHTFLDNPPIPVSNCGALGIPGQAQFHPLKLLYQLAQTLEVYEQTDITEISENTAVTQNGNLIRAKKIVLATHFPMINVPGLYFMKMYQHRSYVVALEDVASVDGMYIDEQENGYSFRNYQQYLLIGGGDHKTGKEGGGYNQLKIAAAQFYPGKQIKMQWATQDCMTLDAIPYIGQHRQTAKNLYLSTGFNKWGMTGSMVGAMLLTDLITKGECPYASLFSPQRSMLHPQLVVNLGAAVMNLLSFGKRCPHMGCALRFNRQERTWDCPCHGSRFTQEGTLIDNPAKRGMGDA